MLTKEIFRKIRRIEIATSRLVTDVFAGQYHSVFKGRGMEFDEVREYIPGDDIRTIDWNVTARTGTPHVKKYVEERELTVMLLVDASLSCHFASRNQMKNHLAAEIAAVLAFSAIRNNDKVGLIFFTDGVEKFIPPRKGSRNVLRLIREILYFNPKHTATNLPGALDYLNSVTTRRTVAFVISDFLEKNEEALAKSLMIANRRHDLVAITLNDPRERELVDCGLVLLDDAENHTQALIDTTSHDVRDQYRRLAVARLSGREKMFRSAGIDHIDVSTDVPYMNELVKFFAKRKQRVH